MGSGNTYTTVRMVDGVHGHTTSLGPAVALDSELMLGAGSLCNRQVRKSTSKHIVSPGDTY